MNGAEEGLGDRGHLTAAGVSGDTCPRPGDRGGLGGCSVAVREGEGPRAGTGLPAPHLGPTAQRVIIWLFGRSRLRGHICFPIPSTPPVPPTRPRPSPRPQLREASAIALGNPDPSFLLGKGRGIELGLSGNGHEK